MIGQILKLFRKLLCMFVILLMTSHHVLPSPLITNSTLHKRQTPLDESENSHNVFTVDDPNEMGNNKIRHKRQECQGSSECDDDQWCYDNWCDYPCPRLQCETVHPDGRCMVRDHQPVCVTAEGLTEQELSRQNRECQGGFQCADDQWCYDNKCEYPCPRLDCESLHPPDGRCIVRDHQPVCVTAEGLTEQELLRQNGGCAFSSDCGANEWCHNDKCEDPCLKMNCGAIYDDGKCSVENHQPVCKPSDEFINLDELGLNRGKGGSCSRSSECETKLICEKGECTDPCEALNCQPIRHKDEKQYTLNDGRVVILPKPLQQECVVWLGVAKCAVIHADNKDLFEEVDA
ncbi:uncharacterized protein LOC111050001 isoform X1 [Nilaparvata lugens]|uniref:uncharacterized protein LOC111050001 isoform X1 n=1 Tax=Nilaparvata lugens TaxID=108931 RepID=UPI00193E44A3|nr:uncharacterized protein LOC111050001 isoform X1 [Nilaparvata lugens]